MGNIAEETGREGSITEMLDTFFSDADLPTRARMRRHWEALGEDELETTRERLETAEGSD